MGQHLEKLDELAHEKSRQEAKERRKKKKEKAPATPAPSSNNNKNQALQEETVEDWVDDDDEDEDDDETEDTEESLLPEPAQVKERMHKLVAHFEESLKAIRGAEPTPELFDHVTVNAYGAETSLQSVAQVVIVSPTLATASCYDPSLQKAVQTALRTTLELNPTLEEDGSLKIPLPRVSMESRQATAKALAQRTEAVKRKIRHVRRKAVDKCKLGAAGKLPGISKDEAFRTQTELEAVTDSVMQQVTKLAEHKHAQIMQV